MELAVAGGNMKKLREISRARNALARPNGGVRHQRRVREAGHAVDVGGLHRLGESPGVEIAPDVRDPRAGMKVEMNLTGAKLEGFFH